MLKSWMDFARKGKLLSFADKAGTLSALNLTHKI